MLAVGDLDDRQGAPIIALPDDDNPILFGIASGRRTTAWTMAYTPVMAPVVSARSAAHAAVMRQSRPSDPNASRMTARTRRRW
jgi:hypothetical protein